MSASDNSIMNFSDLDLGFDPSVAYNGGFNVVDYSGSTTYDDVTPGSDVLGLGGQDSDMSTYDLWDIFSPSDDLSFTGVSDPPFASANASTPYPNSQPASDSLWSSISSLSKLGASFASLLIPHTSTQIAGTQRGTVTGSQPPIVSNSNTLILIVVIVAVIILLLNNGGE